MQKYKNKNKQKNRTRKPEQLLKETPWWHLLRITVHLCSKQIEFYQVSNITKLLQQGRYNEAD